MFIQLAYSWHTALPVCLIANRRSQKNKNNSYGELGMKLIKNDTVIVTLLTLALFSFVKSLEASPAYLTNDIPGPVISSGHSLNIPKPISTNKPRMSSRFSADLILSL